MNTVNIGTYLTETRPRKNGQDTVVLSAVSQATLIPGQDIGIANPVSCWLKATPMMTPHIAGIK